MGVLRGEGGGVPQGVARTAGPCSAAASAAVHSQWWGQATWLVVLTPANGFVAAAGLAAAH